MTAPFATAVALLLAAGGSPVPSPPVPDAAALPAGDSPAWRAAMLGWSGRDDPAHHPASSVQMERPVATGWLSSRFGERSDPFGTGWRAHRGVDIAAPLGTPVVASSDGVVSFAGVAGGYGSMVQIDHPTGFQTRYGHLSRILAHTGEMVRRGEVIGAMGSTGRSTGSHLHFEVRVAGLAVDPQRPLPGSPDAPARSAPVAAPAVPHWQGMTVAADHLPAAYR